MNIKFKCFISCPLLGKRLGADVGKEEFFKL